MAKTEEQIQEELKVLYTRIDNILARYNLDGKSMILLRCDIATLYLNAKIEAYKEFRVNS